MDEFIRASVGYEKINEIVADEMKVAAKKLSWQSFWKASVRAPMTIPPMRCRMFLTARVRSAFFVCNIESHAGEDVKC